MNAQSERARAPLARLWAAGAVGLGLLAGLVPWLVQRSPVVAAVVVGAPAVLVVLAAGWPFSGVATLIAAAVLTHYRFDVGAVSVRPEHLAAVVTAVLGGLQLIVHRRGLRMPVAAWFGLAWWAMNLISGLFFSPLAASGLQNGVRVGVGAITFILMVNLIPDRRRWWWAVCFYAAVGIAEASFGILARLLFPFGINLGVQVSWNFTEPIPYGTFEEGNLFGSHIAIWAILILALLAAAGPIRQWQRRRFLLAAGLGVLLLGLFLSLSRAAWLTLVVGAALVWIFQGRNPWLHTNRLLLSATAAPFVVLLVLAITPYLPASLPFVDRLQSFLTLSSDPTFSARLNDWGLAWNDWLQQPLTGWGPGSFYDLHGLLRANPAWISNLSLRLLQETGILGFLSFLGFFLALLVPAIKTVSQQPDHRERIALLGLVIGFLVLIGLAYQSTDGIWLAAGWVHAGLIAAGTRILNTEAPSGPP
jgi:O-antigen ligase